MSTIREKCFVCDTEIVIDIEVSQNGPMMGGPEHKALVNKFLRRYQHASADEVRAVLQQALYEMGTAQLREKVNRDG